MAFPDRPLCYCTNVHPGNTVDEVIKGIEQFAAKVAGNLDFPIAVGLWFSRAVEEEMSFDMSHQQRIKNALNMHNLTCYTLNAFPFGNFHEKRVKENVYLPDWSDLKRAEYTGCCAYHLADFLDDEIEGSISTLPLGFKHHKHPEDFIQQCISNLIELANELHTIYQQTGKIIRLAIEPEPFCMLETTTEAIDFFAQLFQTAESENKLDLVKQYIGLCYDVCHQAVEFEDAASAIQQIDQAGIRINKVQLSCAIEAQNPAHNPEVSTALLDYLDEKYLHQTMARLADGNILKQVDLTQSLIEQPDADWSAAEIWRVHYHVPVYADTVGPLKTTRPELVKALAAIKKLDYAPDLEVETYTWSVLPADSTHQVPDLATGLTHELQTTQKLILKT